MPCNSDYMQANDLEINLSRVLLLLQEIKTGVPVDANSNGWRGYLEGVYCKSPSRKDLDKAVAELCGKLTNVSDIKRYSLEMQLWWREHQEADQSRLKASALAKLSPAERKVLGL